MSAKRVTIALLCILALALLAPRVHAGAKIVLTYSNFFPPLHKVSLLSEGWCREVERRTGGKVKINYFPGGALTRPTQTYDSVVKGVADIGLSFCAYTRGRFPLTEVIDLPLGYWSALIGTKLANAYYERFKPKEFDDVKLLYLLTSPPHRLFTKSPVRDLEGLRGLKIRSTGTSAKVVKALGGVPVAMPMSDAYDAIRKGIAEGIVCPFEPLKGFKLLDVVNYGTLFSAAYLNVAYVVMNKGTWEALPQDVKDVIEEVNREWAEKSGRVWDELEEEGRKAFLKKGGKVIELSREEDDRWRGRLQPILQEYAKEKEAQGLPAREALEFYLDYLKRHR